jgi:hypothetical protein
MRESRTYGSVRGALSNERPYRDSDTGGGAGGQLGLAISVTHETSGVFSIGVEKNTPLAPMGTKGSNHLRCPSRAQI